MYHIVKTSFTTEKLEIKNNHIRGKNFKLKPKISRKTGKIKNNVFYSSLILQVTSTSEEPFPIDINIDFKGLFEFSPDDDQEDILYFLKTEAVKILFPYLRTMLTSLTTIAMLPPIILPILDVSKLFPDDRETAYVN
ncbi:protein-export chaperone SecB [Mycoplasmatota bacterium]|nr:protein-export chaperone SecB [Mycoplasmatota bacterium]